MADIGSIDIIETASERLRLTVTLERMREFRVRFWIACRLIALAGWAREGN